LFDLEKTFAEVLKVHGQETYTLPWRRIGGFVHIGNSCKSLFTQLLIHHLNKVVSIKFSDGGASRLGEGCDTQLLESFLGITQVVVLKPDAFDAVDSGIHTLAWVRANLHPSKSKAFVKHWHTAGMAEICGLDKQVYSFNADLRKRHLDTTDRASSKKRAADGVSNQSKRLCVKAAELDAVEVLHAMAGSRVPVAMINASVPAAAVAAMVPVAMINASVPPAVVAVRIPVAMINASVPPAITTASAPVAMINASVPPAVVAANVPPAITTASAPTTTTLSAAGVPTSFQRAETLERRAAVAELRASAAELHAVAADLRVDAIELQARVNAMHAEANRLDQRSAANRAEAARMEGRVG
jgi:hypothetical protein